MTGSITDHRFINADLTAAGLAPLAPEQELASAGRLFLSEIDQAIDEGEDFAFETTLAGRGHLRRIREMRAAGWRVEMIYLALSSSEMSRMRVAEREAHGGHDIPSADIERRFPRRLRNLLDVYAAGIEDQGDGPGRGSGGIPDPAPPARRAVAGASASPDRPLPATAAGRARRASLGATCGGRAPGGAAPVSVVGTGFRRRPRALGSQPVVGR